MKGVKKLKVEFDVEKGVTIYEVEFTLENIEYDYEINAKTGEIIKKKKKLTMIDMMIKSRF